MIHDRASTLASGHMNGTDDEPQNVESTRRGRAARHHDRGRGPALISLPLGMQAAAISSPAHAAPPSADLRWAKLGGARNWSWAHTAWTYTDEDAVLPESR